MAECYSPLNIRVQGTKARVNIPCGKCVACLNRKRQGWLFRLENELRYSFTALFVTMTLNDDYIASKYEYNEEILDKYEIQCFLKRLRHYCKVANIKYYLVGEYGSKTGRPHYHALFFDLPKFIKRKKDVEGLRSGKVPKGQKKITLDIPIEAILQEAWPYGFVHCGQVTPASINYTTKYMMKTLTYSGLYGQKDRKPFVLMSKKLGYEWLKRNSEFLRKQGKFCGVVEGGKKVSLPRYYKEKIFTQRERAENALLYVADLDNAQNTRDKKFKERGENPYMNDIMKKVQETIKAKKEKGGVL